MVQCHCHPKWEYYAPGMEAAGKPMSPHYLLKLKKGGVLALVGIEAELDASGDATISTLAVALQLGTGDRTAARLYMIRDPPASSSLPRQCAWRAAATAWRRPPTSMPTPLNRRWRPPLLCSWTPIGSAASSCPLRPTSEWVGRRAGGQEDAASEGSCGMVQNPGNRQALLCCMGCNAVPWLLLLYAAGT